MGRAKKNIKLKITGKPCEIKDFRTGDYQMVISFSSQARYDHFDTLPERENLLSIYYSRIKRILQTIFVDFLGILMLEKPTFQSLDLGLTFGGRCKAVFILCVFLYFPRIHRE